MSFAWCISEWALVRMLSARASETAGTTEDDALNEVNPPQDGCGLTAAATAKRQITVFKCHSVYAEANSRLVEFKPG